jgi:CPA1 family monovalent cation:H+ antiporter
MHTFDLIAILTVLAAGFSFVNARYLKLPPTIGLMAVTLAFSVGLFVIGLFAPAITREARELVGRFDFNQTVLHGMLGFLLFAGALHIELGELAKQRGAIAILATVGVAISTLLVGTLTWIVSGWIGLSLQFIECLLFGALISPTDPIAVLALLRRIGVPKTVEIQIAGESLFNDGVGVVMFTGLLGIATGQHQYEVGYLATLLLREAVGGAVFGLCLGLLVYYLLRSVDDYQVEILLSLGLVAGGYALADAIHVSGPIAMVVAGLLIGNHGRMFAMSPTTIQHLDLFWKLVDEILNAVLFVLVGLEVLVATVHPLSLAAGLLVIPIVLLSRLVSVGLPVLGLRLIQRIEPGTVAILTWGGLRGGISVALALSLLDQPAGAKVPGGDVILVLTYAVVVFSILVQGLTIGPLTRRWLSGATDANTIATG